MFASSGSGGLLLFVTVFSCCIISNHGIFGQTTDYCAVSSCAEGQQTVCLYPNSTPSSRCARFNNTGLLSENETDAIVSKHNEWREKVAKGLETLGNPGPQPPASNMKKLKWDDELARVAQRYADQCLSGHDRCRNVDRFVVGQNIVTMWDSKKINVNTEYLMQGWYDEVKLFNENNVAKYSFDESWGHYSQIVWANTSYVGCGRVLYWDTERQMNCVRLICNYGPAGNYASQPMYEIGTAGSACSSGVTNTVSGLCD